MLFLIAGRTGRGKDTLREYLEKDYGWKFVKSCTTRPKRTPSEDTHIFVTKEEADAVSKDDIAAYTKFGQYEYYVTNDMLDDSMYGYIIDTDGIECLCKKFPDRKFYVIYITANENSAREHAIRRGDRALESQRFNERSNAEVRRFKDFEKKIHEGTLPSQLTVTVVNNDYRESTMRFIAGVVDKLHNKMK